MGRKQTSIYKLADLLDYRVFHEVLPDGSPGDRCVLVKGERALGGPIGRRDLRMRLVRLLKERVAAATREKGEDE